MNTWLLFAAILTSPSPAAGDETRAAAIVPVTPKLRAAPASGDLRVDGRLDEPAWQAAEAVTRMTMIEPTEGGVPTQATEVRVLVGPTAIYIGVRCHDDDPSGIVICTSWSVTKTATLSG